MTALLVEETFAPSARAQIRVYLGFKYRKKLDLVKIEFSDTIKLICESGVVLRFSSAHHTNIIWALNKRFVFLKQTNILTHQ